MANIHLQNDTKYRLDKAITIYIEEHSLSEDLGEKISYDFIVNEMCQKLGVPK